MSADLSADMTSPDMGPPTLAPGQPFEHVFPIDAAPGAYIVQVPAGRTRAADLDGAGDPVGRLCGAGDPGADVVG